MKTEMLSKDVSHEGNLYQGNALGCNRFECCSAPICPMNEGSIVGSIWYPDEEICQLQKFCRIGWIRNQKKKAKKIRNKDFYFTKEMLDRNCVITVATEGLDPDKTETDDKRAVKDWLRKHPEKRNLSDAEKVEMGLRLKRGLELKGKGADNRQNSSFNSQSA